MKFKTRLVAAALSAVWLSGCGSLMRSDYQAPEVQVPANWQQMHVADDVSMDPWWLAFNDPTLNQYITQVLAQNNDLTLATLTLKKARLQLGLAQDDLFPTLSSSTSGQVQKSLDSGESADSYSTNLSVNYELDLWGKISADVDQAKWTAMASQQDREATAQSLVATTASLYWQIGYLKQRLNLSQRNVEDAAQTLQLIEKQYQLGAVDQLDVLEAKRTLASLQAQQSEFEQSLLEANNAFAILFNQPPKSISANIQMLPEGDMPSLSVGAPSDLLIRRPDIKAAIYEVKAALANKDAADLDYLPKLTLTGALGGSSQALKDLLSNPIGSLGADMTLPFLQWSEMKNSQAIADLDYQSAIVSYRQVLYAAFQDVENALSAREKLKYQAARLQEQYDAASAAESIYAARYQYGSTSIMDYLNAQEDTRNAQASLLENRYNQFLNQVTLYQSLGGTDVAPL
ncbi:efflux transporter outer membrane subunit [Vibrio parahaemolyticus]|uniref:efflux transporter outer membrane subunit n=1 Tax=Vibrio parahaemolyticus TaxID=670 RepID=UPI00226AB4E6|nr:efflux transporter outer membrane subunit [Vibrio parahaemolyticus]MCX8893163.1 efflux transporter outer membrane subunit [Vibrio parahaemolyticus]